VLVLQAEQDEGPIYGDLMREHPYFTFEFGDPHQFRVGQRAFNISTSWRNCRAPYSACLNRARRHNSMPGVFDLDERFRTDTGNPA
jgi:hypothetical protein